MCSTTSYLLLTYELEYLCLCMCSTIEIACALLLHTSMARQREQTELSMLTSSFECSTMVCKIVAISVN